MRRYIFIFYPFCFNIDLVALEMYTLPNLFADWRVGMRGAFVGWERNELRGSRSVLRETDGEVPAVYSPLRQRGFGSTKASG